MSEALSTNFEKTWKLLTVTSVNVNRYDGLTVEGRFLHL